jgi:hypothetical protein
MTVATAIPEFARDLWTDTFQDEDATASSGVPCCRSGGRRSQALTRIVRIRSDEQDEGMPGGSSEMLLFQVGKRPPITGVQSFVAEMRAEQSQIGYAGEAVTTSSPWPLLWRQPELEVESCRGVFSIDHEYRELFSDAVELDLSALRRWQPQIIITRRMLETDDE